MFTGLVMGLGRIEDVRARGEETRFRIKALFDLDHLVLGESIAVNGACLTVETAGDKDFSAYASAETLSKTGLGALKAGSTVNLERALALGDRLGGHMVAGHVDCQARIESVTPAGQSTRLRLTFPREFSTQVVPKGSVALDGISLTVNECGDGFLTVNIIPSTLGATTIGSWKPGVSVNMETDLIGKYVLRLLGPWKEAGGGKGSRLTEGFLREHGF